MLNQRKTRTQHEGGGASKSSIACICSLLTPKFHRPELVSGPQKAFTLAEVLITLAIIGVVAALTIPTVVRNYQKMQLKTALKKQWSVMNQALNQTAFEMGGAPNCYYPKGVGSASGHSSDCVAFLDNFQKKFKVIKTCQGDAINKGCQPVYASYATSGCGYWSKTNMPKRKTSVLADGAIIIFYDFDSGTLPHIAVDVNGIKPPNKSGYDLFDFTIRSDGKKLYFDNNITLCLPRTDSKAIPYCDANGASCYSKVDEW